LRALHLFLIGKIVEALKESSYWAVNRTTIFSLSSKREEREATRNTGVLFLLTAVGSVASGFAISYFGFSITLGFLIVVAGAIGFPAVLLWKSRNRDSELNPVKIRGLLKLGNYGRKFWFVSITLLFFGLAYYPLLNLLLPVFMAQQLGYSYITIGVAYMLFNVIAATIVFGALRFSLGAKGVISQSCIAMFALLLLTYSNSYFLGMFLGLAVAEGLGMGFFESVIAKATIRNQASLLI
jgi:MFS family permease